MANVDITNLAAHGAQGQGADDLAHSTQSTAAPKLVRITVSGESDSSIVPEVPLERLKFRGEGIQVLRIGRHPANDVVLDATSIPLLCSRFHSWLLYDHTLCAFVVVDKNTTNGTYVRPPSTQHCRL
jgi:hypothetical protein